MTLKQLKALGYRFHIYHSHWRVHYYVTEKDVASSRVMKAYEMLVAEGCVTFPDAKVLNKTRQRHNREAARAAAITDFVVRRVS